MGERPLRVGLDAFPALTHPPGVGRYARELARALAALCDGPRLRLLELGRAPRVLPASALGAAADLRVRVPLPARAGRWLAGLGLDPARLCGGVDLFHQVRRGAVPVRSAPTTLAVSEWCAPGEEARFAEELAGHAGLLVFSHHYRERLEGLGLDPARIFEVPVGADHWLRDLGARPEAVPRGPRPRVLVLGAPRPGRGHLEVLEACERLDAGGRELELVFASTRVDRSHPLAARLERSGLGERVSWTSPPEAALARLVAGCDLLVHLSEDEGTAVTPAEAVLLGLAVLLSPLPAFREVLGEAAHWHAPHGDLAEEIDQALRTRPSREVRRLLTGELRWSGSARLHVEAWRRLLGR